jgi:hypothetical protein
VVTDVPFGMVYAAFHALFHRGVFADPRPWIYATLEGRGSSAIPSHALSGGLSAWRKEVFSEVPFDTSNGFHMLEDLDFSTRVRARFGDRMAILPGARLEHHFAPAGRRHPQRRSPTASSASAGRRNSPEPLSSGVQGRRRCTRDDAGAAGPTRAGRSRSARVPWRPRRCCGRRHCAVG